jgi:hypothetical protein
MTIEQLASLGIKIDRGQLAHGFDELTTLSVGHVPHHFRDDVGVRIPKPPITEDLSRFQPKGKGIACQRGGMAKKPRATS